MKIFIKKIHFNCGFTIIETLVAIAILMISIAGPLTIAQKGLTSAVYAKDQSIAAFLAQDVIEFVKNERAERMAVGDDWLNDPILTCTSTNPCAIDTTVSGAVNSGGPYVLYLTSEGFRPGVGGDESRFSRKFYLEEIYPARQYKAIVIVEWNGGAIQNAVTLEDHLFPVQL